MNYKREREQLNLTAREVAKAAYISLRRYHLIEAGTVLANPFEDYYIRSALDYAKRRAAVKLEHWNQLNESK